MPNEYSDIELPPAERLAGMTLKDGWKIESLIPRSAQQTGSAFSRGYIAVDTNGNKAFVKALDLTSALQEDDFIGALEKAIQAFKFEEELLHVCKSRRMSKVARAIVTGVAEVDNSRLGRVPYVVFEPAEGDLRNAISTFRDIDVSWALCVLHEAAIGLQQLHFAQVAHQDLKPSNVLCYNEAGEFKLTDLGRASRKGSSGPWDAKRIPGGWSIAAPELQYGELNSDWTSRRFAADLYALGSLGVFLFFGAGLNAIVKQHLQPELRPEVWGGTFREALPFLRDAYAKSFEQISPNFTDQIAIDTLALLRQLGDPDPSIRGWPRGRGIPSQQYAVDKFGSAFANLRSRARYASKARARSC